MDNFKIIYKILSALEKSMDLESVDTERISSNNLGISQQLGCSIENWQEFRNTIQKGAVKYPAFKKESDGHG